MVALLTVLLVAGCSKPAGPPAGTESAQLSGYNHTSEYIHSFSVDGQWGGNVFAFTGGGSFVCCVVYPIVWRPGLMAHVRWSTSSSDPNASGPEAADTWHDADVEIERYEKPGTTLNVHFLEKGRVRLIITSGSDMQPNYPGPRLPPNPAGSLPPDIRNPHD